MAGKRWPSRFGKKCQKERGLKFLVPKLNFTPKIPARTKRSAAGFRSGLPGKIRPVHPHIVLPIGHFDLEDVLTQPHMLIKFIE